MGIVNCIFTVLGKPIDEKDEQVMLSFHNMTIISLRNGVINLSQTWDKEKKSESPTEIEPNMWQEIFAGSNFCGFSSNS